MKRGGCFLGIAGLLLCVGSFVIFGRSIFRAMSAREAGVVPILVGSPADSGVVTVATDKLCRVAVRGTVRSGHARPATGEGSSWNLEYALPFRYTVFDEAGGVILEESVEVASGSGMKTSSQNRVSEDGGSVHVEHGYEKFQVVPPGRVRVVGHIDADRDFGAEIEGAELVIYDNVSRHVKQVATGVVLMLVGGFAGLIGAVLYIVAALRGTSGGAPEST